MSQATSGSSGSGFSSRQAAKSSRCVQWTASAGQWTKEIQAAESDRRGEEARHRDAGRAPERPRGDPEERQRGERRQHRPGGARAPPSGQARRGS